MKKLFLLTVLSVTATFSSCKYDDDNIWGSVHRLENRVAKLEELCKQMNTNISALQTIVGALQNNDYVTGVAPVTSNGETIGYTITFSKSTPITIYHGQNGKDGANGADGKDGVNGKDGHTPVIGVYQDTDGIYYWTLDGDWLRDESGKQIKAEGHDGQDGTPGKDGQDGAPGADGKDGVNGKDGITPQLKIENGYWFVSTDNGATWTNLGKATGENGKDGVDGDSMFQNITQDDKNVYFTLADNTIISVPKANATENIKFEDSLVKALCIANWDIDCDGELSHAEAAAVTTLGDVFKGTHIHSFNELTHFTGLTAIDDHAFDGCSELCSVNYPSSVTTIGIGAFYGTGLINILIPETIKTINASAFSNCKQVQRIDLRYSLTINQNVFSWTTGKVYLNCNLPNYQYTNGAFQNSYISKLIVGNNVEVIGDYAFYECNFLSEIEFASKGRLHTIGIGNFFKSAITAVEIPVSLQTLGDYVFGECNSLVNITGYSTNFQSRDNVLMYITGYDNRIVLYPPGRNDETYKIPEYIKVIGNSAFRKCNNLKNVVFPEKSISGYEVSEIDILAFYNCENLISVPNLENTIITRVPRSAFAGCKKLKTIALPATLENIAIDAFSDCESLTLIDASACTQLQSVDEAAFSGNIGLKHFKIGATVPPICGERNFTDIPKNAVLEVPAGYLEAYRNAEGWKEFANITESSIKLN